MKAVICPRYGPPEVLRVRDVPDPVPGDDEILIRVRASSINSRDWRILRANPFIIRIALGGYLRPKQPILGADVAGQVEAVGSDVSQFRPGDEVFGFLSGKEQGAYAEYVCARESEITLKPADVSFEQAAATPLAAITALQGLRDRGKIQPGQKVLIQGASGGVGTFAVQIAKYFGAEVTAVCSARNVEMVRSLGADRVLDYRKEDFAQGPARYDLILAVNGYRRLADYLRALGPAGRLVVAGGSMRQLIEAGFRLRNAKGGGQEVSILSAGQKPADLALITDLLAAGKIHPVIDDCYPLAETAAAFGYYEREHPRGKVVIRVVG